MLTRTLILGLAASSIVFLSSYVGMVSLAQYLLVGVASFTIGNCVAESGKGLKLGLDPWLAVVLALVIATSWRSSSGALASRTTGIYFLMLTLTYAVIGYYVFGQVTSISGFGGITGVNPPGFFDTHPCACTTPCSPCRCSPTSASGRCAAPVRADPRGHPRRPGADELARVQRAAPPHAGVRPGRVRGRLAGVINIWWNGQIDPNSVNIGATLDLFIVAVIGGISHLEGAWLGAFVFVVANNYMRSLPLVDRIGITEAASTRWSASSC